MKKVSLKDLSLSDLKEKIREEKDFLAKLKFNHTVSPIENPMKIRHYRKNIARMLTELRQRELAETKNN
jgi:large subunit ribosomal protein L29